MFKKIFIVFLFLFFFPSVSYGADNRLIKDFETWKVERDKQVAENQPSKTDQNSGQPILYRNDDYKFRINFPAGWELKDGDGTHVVKKAVRDGCTVLVLVKDFLTETEKNNLSIQEKNELKSAEFSDFSNEEAEQFLDEMIKENETAFPDSRTIEKEIRYIDNHKAGYYKVSIPYKAANIETRGINIVYFTIHKGRLYQIMGAYPTEPVNEKDEEPIINTIMA